VATSTSEPAERRGGGGEINAARTAAATSAFPPQVRETSAPKPDCFFFSFFLIFIFSQEKEPGGDAKSRDAAALPLLRRAGCPRGDGTRSSQQLLVIVIAPRGGWCGVSDGFAGDGVELK